MYSREMGIDIYLDPLPGNSAPNADDFGYMFRSSSPPPSIRIAVPVDFSPYVGFADIMAAMPDGPTQRARIFNLCRTRSNRELLVYEEA